MNRRILGIGIALLAVPLAELRCSTATPPPQAPDDNGPTARPGEPATAPSAEPETAAAPATEDQPVCLPLAYCGCFDQQRCVTGRVQGDGVTVDILDGEHAGTTGHLLQDCWGGGPEPADCVDYVDPAMICRRLLPAADRAAKYLCATENLILAYRCGFVDGVCSVLPRNLPLRPDASRPR